MIVVIDYGMGNLGSIVNTLHRIGVTARVSSDPELIMAADRLILPGVGSFKKGVQNLEAAGLIPALEKQVVDKEVPILGICLGMQLFCNASEEGDVKGLGWIDAEIVRFRFGQKGSRLRIPHMGWNSINPTKDTFLTSVSLDDRFYFVHSFHVTDIDENLVIGSTNYGYTFPSVIRQGNIIGIQCHPERSHSSGVRVMKNFLDL